MDGLGSSWTPDGTQPVRGDDALRAPDRVDADAAFPSGPSGASAEPVDGDPLGPAGPDRPGAAVPSGKIEVRADLAGAGRGTGGDGWTDASALGGFVLPPMPTPGEAPEHADALTRWMDDDRARTDDAPPAPPVPSPRAPGSPQPDHGHDHDPGHVPASTRRDVRTTGLAASDAALVRVPARTDDVPVAPWRIVDSAPPRPRQLGGEAALRQIGTPGWAGDEAGDDLDPTLRAQREERDFERQFGAWREGTVRAPTPKPASKIPVLLLAILILVIAWFALLGGMR